MPPRRLKGPQRTQTGGSLGWANPDMLQFIQLKMKTFVAAADTPDHPDFMKLHSEAVMEITGRSTESLQAGADRGVAVDRLNLAVRHLTGCGAIKDVDEAIDLLEFLVPISPEVPHVNPAPRSVEARANSVLASAWMDIATRGTASQIDLESLHRAALFANNAAALGFVPPIVLVVAKRLEDFGARSAADWEKRVGIPYDPKYARFEYLWEAFDRRVEEMERELRAQDKKVAKRPSSYCCAAPGCGIIATKKAALLKCSGGCPAESKAHYCSKECQNADWKRHKPTCRPRKCDVESTASTDSISATRPSSDPNRRIADGLVTDGKERSIVIDSPGGKITLSSTTMGPTALRDMRAAIEKISLSG